MEILIPIIVLIASAILHEVAHGFVADKLGDPTARLMGRLTLNPLPHIDPLMSIIIPTFLIISGSPIIFGAAKPVPINPLHFSDPKKDTALTALAGPITNILLAIGGALLIHLIGGNIGFLGSVLQTVVIYNILLAILNLIPIPPLDGSKVVASILPDEMAARFLSIDQFVGFAILLFLLYTPLGVFSLSNVIHEILVFSLRLLGM